MGCFKAYMIEQRKHVYKLIAAKNRIELVS